MEFSYVIWGNTLNLNKQRITWPRRETKFLFECWKKFEQVKYFLTWKKKFRIFKKPCNVLLLLVYKHQWNTKTFHFNIFFGCEWCDLSCSHRNNVHFTSEDNMLFLHEKVSCFYTEAHRHFIGGCITSKIFVEGCSLKNRKLCITLLALIWKPLFSSKINVKICTRDEKGHM